MSDEPDRLVRLAFGPAWREAVERVRGWMGAAGLATRIDAAGNLLGRREGPRPGSPALVLGSHLDTVIDAGRFDGTLGVLLALALVERLRERGRALPFALEVVAFADEEGVRFGTGLLGSRAMAGTLDPAVLGLVDRHGTSLARALWACGLEPEALARAARRPEEILGYLEVHIEQGPVLEREGLALGPVEAIAGAERSTVEVLGEAGHAGTVPMEARKDALAAAAEMVLAVERVARGAEGVVATVGRLEVEPGAVNTVPGRVRFTIDLRSGEDSRRAQVSALLHASLCEIARRRGVGLAVATREEFAAVRCDARLLATLEAALAARGRPVRRLVSGAGHDAAALAAIAPVAMLFVRCRGGVSHHPAEDVDPEDVAAALEVLEEAVERLAAETTPAPV
ncbi:MAG: allantoate amidohydrolase [Geminicoccaceae bacterium]|nr:allantoate amidohydrolase [Geminicoccaceae bacterium]